MKKLLALLLISTNALLAQLQPLTIPNAGGNKKASVTEHIGLCEVKINYHRPGVKGREGKIWGTNIAHYGLKDLQFGSSKAAPWRVGANESTVISFTTPVQIEGKDLLPGTYGLFIELGEKDDFLILNKNSTAWGSFSYNPLEDVLKVKIHQESQDKSVEWMKFEFENQSEDAAILALYWEKRKMYFNIKVDVNKTQFESFKKELETPKGFSAAAFVQAANFCLLNNYEMEQGLAWAERAIKPVFPGERSFITLNTVANYYTKLGNEKGADSLMKEAIPLGTTAQVNVYARSLITKRPKVAFEIYKSNYEKAPNTYAGVFGMMRGYWAIGDTNKAIEFAQKALALAPTPSQKTIVELVIKDIHAGKPAN